MAPELARTHLCHTEMAPPSAVLPQHLFDVLLQLPSHVLLLLPQQKRRSGRSIRAELPASVGRARSAASLKKKTKAKCLFSVQSPIVECCRAFCTKAVPTVPIQADVPFRSFKARSFRGCRALEPEASPISAYAPVAAPAASAAGGCREDQRRPRGSPLRT